MAKAMPTLLFIVNASAFFYYFQSLMVIEPFFNIYLYHYNICTYQCHYMCGSIHYYNKCIFYP